MSIDIDFESYLTSLTTSQVQQNYLSEDKSYPAVWFQRRNASTELLLNGGISLIQTQYDVAVYGDDPDAAGAVADHLTVSLNGFRGAMGNTTVLGAFVSDADDDFIRKEFNADEGIHVFAFAVQILS